MTHEASFKLTTSATHSYLEPLAANGLPFIVQRNGFAIVALKWAMNPSILCWRCCLEVKLPRRRSLRTRIENQISIWLIQG
jgi:hypothetical protein